MNTAIWILIFISSRAVFAQEFYSKEKCEAAKENIVASNMAYKSDLICVQK
jgi:hypothetical protein